MDAAGISMVLGILNGIVLFALGAFRRQCNLATVGASGAVFLATQNIYPPAFLMYFVICRSTRVTLPPTLAGYEKYICVAGLFSLLVSVVGIVGFYKAVLAPRTV
jgi:hypothetical protein